MARKKLNTDLLDEDYDETNETNEENDDNVVTPTNSYFANPSPNIEFLSSGCTVLNCVLGGGYPLGRIVNIVGDKSTGKTLLAIEASANFASKYEEGHIWYSEVESAFDRPYAKALGMPIDRIDFTEDIYTVEDFYEDILKCIAESKKTGQPGLYILDSLDALSDRSELDRDIDKGSYGGEKAKKMSELFRRLVQKLENSKITVLIISQVRDNIGVMFGSKHKRSGGRALDFYASQVIYLAHTKTIERTRSKIKRAVAIQVKAKCNKNKVGLPFRTCEFQIVFGFGVDDVWASIHFLNEVSGLDKIGLTKSDADTVLKNTMKLPVEEYNELWDKSVPVVKELWQEIETDFLPNRSKY